MVFLCAITPVFDECLPAFQLLTASLQEQTFKDFIHVAVSNGESPTIKKWISELGDPRFIYDEFPREPTPSSDALFINLCKRRNYGLKKYQAHRFVFLDADLKIITSEYFELLKHHHQDPLVILAKIKNGPSILPRFPVELGTIDIANYSVSQSIAKTVDYPIDISCLGYANDFRFYTKLENFPYLVLPPICGIKDGNKSYLRFTERN